MVSDLEPVLPASRKTGFSLGSHDLQKAIISTKSVASSGAGFRIFWGRKFFSDLLKKDVSNLFF